MSWSQWPGPAPQQPPVVAATGPLLNPAPAVIPPGMPYNPTDQWAQMQQQNWQQWAQWQQQYQQWHQQYGAEYHKSMNALAAQQTVVPNMGVPPPLPIEPQPPLPKDDGPKPPLPLTQSLHQQPPIPQPPMGQYSTQLPPNNNFSAPPPNFTSNAQPQQNWRVGDNNLLDQKRPLDQAEESANKRQMLTNKPGWKPQNTPVQPPQRQVPPVPNTQNNPEELSEAEKKFDKQFAEWEAQFNKWKDQNSGHPDKQQYKEYEKKWEQWRQQLLDRREAMRKKRLSLSATNKPAPNQNFNLLPPLQGTNPQSPGMAQNAPPPNQNSGPKSNLPAPGKQPLLPTPNVFGKPPPDMNDEPLQFKKDEEEPEGPDGDLGFLNSSKSEGIPGLDLVKEGDVAEEVLTVPEEAPQKGPDLEALSKGINNILGDQKLMSMLSMVSQNQNVNVNTTSRMHDVVPSQDQSNLSMDDSRHEPPIQSETVQNFDDQTRSSFTMQPNESDFYRGGPPPNSQYSRGGPQNQFENEPPTFNRFDNRPFGGPPEDDYRRPPPSQNRFGRGVDTPMDDFIGNRGPPMNRNVGLFDRAPPGGHFDRAPPSGASFDRAPPSLNRAPTGPNFDKAPPDNFSPRFMNEGPGRRDSFGPLSGAGNFARDSFGPGGINKSPLGPGPGGMNRSLLGQGPGAMSKGLLGCGPAGMNKSPVAAQGNFGSLVNRDDFGPPIRGNDNFGSGMKKDLLNRQMDENLNRGNFNGPPGGLNRDRFGPPDKSTMHRDNFDSNNRNRDSFGGRQFDMDSAGPNRINFGEKFVTDIEDRDNDPGDDFGYGNDNNDYDQQVPDDLPKFDKDNFGRPPPNDRFSDGPRGYGNDFNGPPRNFNLPRDDFTQMPPNMRLNQSPGFGNDRIPPRRDSFGQRDDTNDRFTPRLGDRPMLNKGNLSQDQGRFENRGGGNMPSNRFGDKFSPNNFRDERGSNFKDQGSSNFRDNRPPSFRDERSPNFRDRDFDKGNFRQNDNYAPPPPLFGPGSQINFGPRRNSFGIVDAPAPPDFSEGRFKENQYGEEMSQQEEPSSLEQSIEDIWKPESVIDYEHKSLNPPEMDVLLQPFRMFDYCHKPLRRIPFPDRPNWLSDAVRMIPEFDPPVTRYTERRLYEDRFEPPQRRDDRERFEMFRSDDRHRFERDELRFSPPRHRGREGVEGAWSSGRRNRSRSPPPRFDRRSAISDRYDSDRKERGRNRSRERIDKESRRDWNDKEDGRKGRNDWEEDGRKGRNDWEEGEDRWKERKNDWGDDNDFRDKEKRTWKSNEEESWRKRDRDWDERGKAWKEDDMDTGGIDSRSREKDLKYRNRSRERDNYGKKSSEPIFPVPKPEMDKKSNVTLIEDLIDFPGRSSRPPRIVIILRGPPGSGKTYLAKLIKDKEVENGGSAPRILSLDDYFMIEQEKETIEDGKKVKIKEMIYEFEEEMEESYRTSFMKSFKKTITDGYFPFIIVDNVNDKVKYFGEMWSFAKQNGFQVYVCQLDLDVQNCIMRNIHKRTEEQIRKCVAGWENTPSHHSVLDASVLLQEEPIREVEMEEINSPSSSNNDREEGLEDQLDRSKWDNFDCSLNNLARLDGVNKPLRASRTMEEYLQLDDEWQPSKSTKPGQKRVRWADLEERKQQEKMRAIGFVVGQTDWDRMMDPTMGEGALTQTKFIEKVQRRRF